MLRIVFGFVLLFGQGFVSPGVADRLVSQCAPLLGEHLRCDVRVAGDDAIALMRGEWGEGTPAELNFTPYGHAEQGTPAQGSDWLILIDRFGADRWRALFAVKQAVLPALGGLVAPERSAGLSAISYSYDELRPLGSAFGGVLEVIPDIEARGDGALPLGQHLVTAIDALSASNRRRRGLVLVTPASTASQTVEALDTSAVVAQARAAGVGIFVFAFSGSGVEAGNAETLATLAEGTGGMLVPVTAEARPLSAQLGKEMGAMVESGGLVEIATSGLTGSQDLRLLASFSNGDVAELLIPLEIAERSFVTRSLDWFSDGFATRPELALLVGLLAILIPIGVLGTLIMLLGYAVKRRRAAQAADPERQRREREAHKQALCEAERIASNAGADNAAQGADHENGGQVSAAAHPLEREGGRGRAGAGKSGEREFVQVDRGRKGKADAKADAEPAQSPLRPVPSPRRTWLELAEPYTTAADGTPLIPNRPGKVNGIGATELPIEQNMVRIGRHEENDICLKNKTVHRYHAVLHRLPDGTFVVTDLSGETGNGVVINGGRMEQSELSDGDVIELGEVHLRFRQGRKPVKTDAE